MARTFALVLAGGEGKRLWPLTADRAKPAVPFGGNYRLIDFALSNLVNGGSRRIAVLTQYKSHSLDRHLAISWRLSPLLGQYVTPVPAQMRKGPRWFSGSADAVFQNLNLINDERPEHIFVFGADHIYRMDPEQMLAAHLASGAAVTVAAIRVPLAEADQFGVIEVAPGSDRIQAFREKPTDAIGLADAPDTVLASMGNYIFTTAALVDAVTRDESDERSRHDIGGDIIPMLVNRGEANVWDFSQSAVPGVAGREQGYWRDVGTLDSYYEAQMDLTSVDPVFSLYNEDWPILTLPDALPPAKFVHESPGRVGTALDSLVCAGVVVSGGTARKSVLSPGVRIHSGAQIDQCVLMHGVDVGRDAVVRRAIIDKNVRIDPGAQIGVDADADRARFTVTDAGTVVIGKGAHVTA
jgi:glucose-1-phosphate adenylyltransferase